MVLIKAISLLGFDLYHFLCCSLEDEIYLLTILLFINNSVFIVNRFNPAFNIATIKQVVNEAIERGK